jgi:hypothetical protein
LGNPIVIPAAEPVPLNIELPAGFVPGESFSDINGVTHPAGEPLTSEATIPRGFVFLRPFVIPAGQPLRGGEDYDTGDGDLMWIDPTIWEEENPGRGVYGAPVYAAVSALAVRHELDRLPDPDRDGWDLANYHHPPAHHGDRMDLRPRHHQQDGAILLLLHD